MTRRCCSLALLTALLASGCEDPTSAARIESLGPEPGDYPVGPSHRPGQPCTWCHSEGGNAEPFDLAGTIFLRPGSRAPATSVRVRLFGPDGKQRSALTNDAGNFFFRRGELGLSHPLWVKLEGQGQLRAMQTPLRRERSCAGCHRDPAGPSSAGHIYLLEDP